MSWKSITDGLDPTEIAYREGVMDSLQILKDLLETEQNVSFEDAIEIIEETLLGAGTPVVN